MMQCSYKVHFVTHTKNTISYGELSDPLCNSVNRGYDFSQIEDVPHHETGYHVENNVHVHKAVCPEIKDKILQ